MQRLATFSLIAGLALLTACNGHDAPQNDDDEIATAPIMENALANDSGPPVATNPDDPNSMTPSQQLSKAFAVAFPDPRVPMGQDSILFTPKKIIQVGQDWVLFSEGHGQGCEACTGRLAISYLTADSSGFHLSKNWTNAIGGNPNGEPPEWSLNTEIARNPVIVAKTGASAQGYSCTNASLSELMADGPKPLSGPIPMSFSNGGIIDGEAAQSMSGTILPGEKSRSFVVHYTGSVNADVGFVRQGSRFVPDARIQQLPRC